MMVSEYTSTSLVGRLWKLYLGFGVLLLLLYYLVPPFKGNGVLFNFIGLSSAIAIFVGVRLHKPATRNAWRLFAVGQLFFVGGDVFYYGYDALFHKDVPFPSPADFLYLAVYPALIAGLLIIVRRRSPRGDRSSLIDALIVTTGLALVSWVFLMAPYAHDQTLTLLEKLVSMAYPLMDVCLLAVGIRLFVGGGARKPALVLLILSSVSLLATDSILGLLTLNGGYQEGGLLDTGWAVYYLFWGAAALHSSMRTLDREVTDREGRLSRGRLALLTAASLMAPTVQAIQALRGQLVEAPVMVASSATLFCLVVLRMVGLLRESERSTAREKALSEAAKALVAASSPAEVREAALDSMLTLTGPGHHARIAVVAPTGELRARGPGTEGEVDEWPMRPEEVTALDGRSLRNSRPLEVDLAKSPLREALHLPEQAVALLVFPLHVGRELRGLIFVAGGQAFASRMKDAIQTLGVKIALALESAALAEDLLTRKSEARWQSLVQNSNDLITVIEADTTIKYVSPSVERVLGYESADLLGSAFADLLHPHERNNMIALLADSMTSADPQVEVVECRLRHANGAWLLFEILRTNLLDDSNVAGIVLNARDISERKEFERQLTHQAFHDPVTDLANRALFTDRVEHALARKTRDAGSLSIIFLDLDDFKMINDSLGHAAGDLVLKEVGRRLAQCVRPMDTVARFGGDEFAVLLEDARGPEDTGVVAERMLKSMDAAIAVDGKEVFTRASLGIAAIDAEDALTCAADDLIRNADVAMYMAKREGKGHYRHFESQMHTNVLDRLEIKGALQKALERGELTLRYQPVVELPTQKVVGFEALARWEHPERGEISPGEFIPLAEETGLIIPLGDYVLREACQQVQFMQETALLDPPLSISVNVSVKQLQQTDFTKKVAKVLEKTGLQPSRLMLEITESLLMIDTEAMIEKLHELKQLGVQLAVDDFGTGYSSLSYLSRFPIDFLKIDRSFVSDTEGRDQNSALAEAIVRLGETLNLKIVAEGIEEPEQLARFSELGCQLGQGFYFAKPMKIDEAMDFLRLPPPAEVNPETSASSA